MTSFKPAFILIFLPILFLSCSRDEIQAVNSLDGEWEVIAITSYYGEFSATSYNATQTISEPDPLGSFTFVEESVEYEFTRNDTLFMGNRTWDLTFEKVNAGFTKTNQFTLSIENEYEFDLSFGDQTKNAEKEAQNINLRQIPMGNVAVLIEIALVKR